MTSMSHVSLHRTAGHDLAVAASRAGPLAMISQSRCRRGTELGQVSQRAERVEATRPAAIRYDGCMACASLPCLTSCAGLAALLFACAPTTGGDSGEDLSSTGTAADPTTEGPSTTAGGSSSADATTAVEPPTGDAGDTGDAEATGETTGAPDGLVLDPETLVVFELPIGSIRYGVGGFDPAQQTCVTIIFSNPGEQQHCDDFEVGDSSGFPYVYITPGAISSCTDWDYAGNVQLDAATGCMQLVEPSPAMITIDMQLTVSGPAFTGTISVASE
jgi:hypothetical protein